MALYLFDLFTSYVVPTRHMRWRCVVHHFQVKKVKGQGHTGRSNIWSCPLRGSIPFWPIHFIYAHQFRVQRSRSHGSIKVFAVSLCGSVPSWLIHFKCGTHTTHEGTIRRAPFLGQQVKGQGHTVDWSFCSVRSMSPSLFNRFTSYVVHIQPIRC